MPAGGKKTLAKKLDLEEERISRMYADYREQKAKDLEREGIANWQPITKIT